MIQQAWNASKFWTIYFVWCWSWFVIDLIAFIGTNSLACLAGMAVQGAFGLLATVWLRQRLRETRGVH